MLLLPTSHLLGGSFGSDENDEITHSRKNIVGNSSLSDSRNGRTITSSSRSNSGRGSARISDDTRARIRSSSHSGQEQHARAVWGWGYTNSMEVQQNGREKCEAEGKDYIVIVSDKKMMMIIVS